jgi:translation initiation factor IF-3
LKDGDKVKAVVTFRGREISHSEIGRRLMEKLIAEVGETGIVEFHPRMEGFALTAVFAPKK